MPKTLTVCLSADLWGNELPLAEIWLDATCFGQFPVSAVRGLGQSQGFAFTGDFTNPQHVNVYFKNDAYGGSPVLDRNLYVDGVTYDQVWFPPPAANGMMAENSTCQISVAPPAPVPPAPPVYAKPTHAYDFTDTSTGFWQSEDNPPSWPLPIGSPGYFARCLHTGWPSNSGDQDPSARFLRANGEIQSYEASAVANGPEGCTLTATRAPGQHFPQQPWTSGAITQRVDDAMLHGYFEMVASLPQGSGLWPAFWLLPADNTAPPEIDGVEKFGTANEPPGDNVYHVGMVVEYGGNANPGKFVAVSDTAGFHKYAVKWEPGTLTYYCDDAPVASWPEPASYTKAMYMIANLAVGGCAGTPAPDVNTGKMVIRRLQSFALGSWGASTIPLTEPVA